MRPDGEMRDIPHTAVASDGSGIHTLADDVSVHIAQDSHVHVVFSAAYVDILSVSLKQKVELDRVINLV
eukprot:77576-Pyramimonas_sp.AAC.1